MPPTRGWVGCERELCVDGEALGGQVMTSQVSAHDPDEDHVSHLTVSTGRHDGARGDRERQETQWLQGFLDIRRHGPARNLTNHPRW